MTTTYRAAALGGALLVVLAAIAGPMAGSAMAAGTETSGNMGVEDWPVVGHDPGHTGANPDGTGPSETLDDRWKRSPVTGAGAVTGAPVVVGGTVYGATTAGAGGDVEPRAFAMNADGSDGWTTTLETSHTFAQNPEPRSSPAVAGDYVVYAGSDADGVALALHRSNGSVAWDREVGSSARAAPLVVNGTVYVGSAQKNGTELEDPTGPLTALDLDDGTVRWENTGLDGEVRTSPAYAGGSLYVATTAGTVYEIDPADGSVRTEYDAGSNVTTAPTVVDGTVYVGSADGTVTRFGTASLAATSLDGEVAGIAVHGGSVYATTRNDSLYRLDADDLASDASPERFLGTVEDAPAIVGDTVYVRAGDTVHTYDLSLEPRDEHSAYRLTSGVVAADGQAYVGTADGVVALDQRCDPSVTDADVVSSVTVPTDCRTLESAVDAVDHGGTISLEAGTYSGVENTSTTIRKNVTVDARNATLSGIREHGDTAFNGLEFTDGTTLIGGTFTDYRGAPVWIHNASDVTVADVTVGDLEGGPSTRGVLVESRRGASTGGVVIDGLTVESSTAVSSGVRVRASEGADTRTSVSGVTVRGVDVANASVGVNVTASGGATVRDVTVRRSTVAGDDHAVRTEAGPNGSVSGLRVRNVTVPGGTSTTGLGIISVAGADAGDDATVRDVRVDDTTVDGGAAGVAINATTRGTADALVAGVDAVNLTVTDADGPGVSVVARNASASGPTDGALVRSVDVVDSVLGGNDVGLAVDTGTGSHESVRVQGSNVTGNGDGVSVAPGTNATGVTVTDSNLSGNANFGAANDGTGVLDATGNWWGNETGPYDPYCDDGNCNGNGTGDSVTANVTYEPWVSPPIASATANRTRVNVSEAVEFRGSASTESGEIVSYDWTIGDGTSASGRTMTHAFGAGGTYEVTLTVTDEFGDTGSDTIVVYVEDRVAPAVAADAPRYVQPGTNVTFDASNSSDDGEIAYYAWDFDGDGTTDTNTSSATTSHSYGAEGEYTVGLTVGDTTGNENVTTLTVTADGTPPDAALSANRTDVNVSQPVRFDATNGTDEPSGIARYEWDFDGDGERDDVTRTPTTTHAYDAGGEFDATVTVVDHAGNWDRATVSVQVSTTDDGSDGTDGNDGSDGTDSTDGGDGTNDGSDDGSSSPPSGGGSDGTSSSSPAISAVDAALGSPEVVVDETVTVTATYENTGGANGSETVVLTVDGEPRDSTEVTVPAGDDVTVTFSVAFADPGDYDVRVGNLTAGTVGVADPSNVVDEADAVIDDGRATFDDAALETVTFTADGSGDISMRRLSELPDYVDDPNGTVLVPFRVEVPSVHADLSATLQFSVAESRIDAAGVAPEDVRLLRYHDGEWQWLETRVVDASGSAISFEADTPGFSLFAAVAPASAHPTHTPTETVTEPPTETGTDTPTSTATPESPGSETGTTPPPTNPSDTGFGNVPLLIGLVVAVAVAGLVAYRQYGGDGDTGPRIRA